MPRPGSTSSFATLVLAAFLASPTLAQLARPGGRRPALGPVARTASPESERPTEPGGPALATATEGEDDLLPRGARATPRPFLGSVPRTRPVPLGELDREHGLARASSGDGAGGGRRSAARSTGAPDLWQPVGPAPAIQGQVENVLPNDETCGAIHVVVAHPTDADVIYAAGTNGGIWRTRNGTEVNPTWTPLIDHLPSLSIGALAMDPDDPDVLVAGIGHISSLGLAGGPFVGLYRTRDGGDTWESIRDPLLEGNVTGIAVRGDAMLVSMNSFFGFFGVGGLRRSTDGGATWEAVDDSRGFPGVDTFDLVADEAVPGLVYAGAMSRGIYMTEDFGASWTQITSSDPAIDAATRSGSNNNLEMAVAPTNGRLYANVVQDGQSFYIGYTDDRGETWTELDLPGTLDGPSGTVLDATNSTPILLTTEVSHGMSSGDRVQVEGVLGNDGANGAFFVIVLASDRLLLQGSAGTGDYAGGGVWGEVSGLNPRPKPGSQGFIHASIVADPADESILYQGGDRQELFSFPNSIGAFDFTGRLFRADTRVPRGRVIPSPQWAHLTHEPTADTPDGGTLSSSAPHADSREMVVDANGDLIQSDDGGIYRRTNPRSNQGDWVSLLGNLQVTEYHDIAYDTVSNVAFGGAQDTGTTMQGFEGQPAFFTLIGGDGGKVAVDDKSFPDRSIRYTSAQFLLAFNRSTWSASNELLDLEFPDLETIEGPNMRADFYTPITVNEVDPTRLVILAANGIYESLDRGDTVSRISSMGGQFLLLDCVHAGGMRDGVAEPDVLLVGSGNGLFLRDEPEGRFRAITPVPGFLPRDVTVDPDDWRTIYTVGDDLAQGREAVFASSDGGASWSDATGTLPLLDASTSRTIAFVPGPERDLVVIGTRAGAYVTLTDRPGLWAPLGSLPNVRCQELDYDASDDLLVVGTLGRGIWSLPDASTSVRPLRRLEVEEAEVRGAGTRAGEFRLRGRYELEPGRSFEGGVEHLTVMLGGFGQTLSGPDLRSAGRGMVRFDGEGPGLTEVKVKREGRFELRAERVDLRRLDLDAPVLFSLQLGNDLEALELDLGSSGDPER